MFWFWIILAILVIVGGVLSRRNRPTDVENEPWRASLRDEDDDRPLDMDEIRKAEDEWRASEPWETDSEDSDWR